ncbi:RagB/SusD family nutrient uptake outer membrane protein [Maribacter antarcticus]|uniref:RagB/SusD family nutrient uptake outer membrane protein n=1 Tax=Maribacter antarcticus TaxID=505250 RepID=UPI00047B11E5|nr:RagB/SusD family nutrient uptake outer membrane protein [Maribacter antarcticus]
MRNNTKIITRSSFSLLCALLVFSCSIDTVVDPNGPSIDGVGANASKGQLNELVTAIESTLRNGLGGATSQMGSMARELYVFNADPRNTGDVLGKNGIPLDPNGFYVTGLWNSSYRNIKNVNLLLDAAANTELLSDAEQSGYSGFAKTVKAYRLVQLIKAHGKARIVVIDPENLGPIVEFDPAMDAIRALLDEANTELGNAGDSFAFSLSDGFEGFDTPSTFAQFNRAVAAVAALYDGDSAGVLSALNASYFDLAGDLNVGPKHIYGLGAGDQPNPMFKVASTPDLPNNGDQFIVHNSWITEAEAGDARVAAKSAVRPDASSQDDLNGTHETTLYATNVSDIAIIRNEELILVYAEANILASDLPEAETALNIIRTSAALPAYSGPVTADALTTEMLNQRRYSLWAENHRFFDLRRYGLSNTLPIDRTGDQIFNQLPIPLSENE